MCKPTIQLQFPYLICYGTTDGCSAMKLDQDQTGQTLCSDTHDHCQVSNSEILPLPIIDLSPSDESCIY